MICFRNGKLIVRFLLVITSAIIIVFLLDSCAVKKVTPIDQSSYTRTQPPVQRDQAPKTEPPGTPQVHKTDKNSWILITKPLNGEMNAPVNSDISITFNQDMDISTLNPENITVMEGMHSSFISHMFIYRYDPKTRTLHLKFKNPESDYGPENGIMVTITENVANAEHIKMGKKFEFGFSVGWHRQN